MQSSASVMAEGSRSRTYQEASDAGVDTCQGSDQCCFAVIDVTGSADDHRARALHCAMNSGSSAASRQRRSNHRVLSAIRPMTGRGTQSVFEAIQTPSLTSGRLDSEPMTRQPIYGKRTVAVGAELVVPAGLVVAAILPMASSQEIRCQ
jgi:hypothetical protein